MKVAELQLTQGEFMLGAMIHSIGFSDIDKCYAEYERIAALIRNKAERKNDLPTVVECEGINKVSLPLDSLRAVSLCDFAKANNELDGMRDAFPLLFSRPAP